MAGWGWTLIAIGIAAVVAVSVLALLVRRKTTRLRHAFGSEYDRTVQAKDGRRPAEAELRQRERQRAQYSIKTLPEATRTRFAAEWRGVQQRFVDHPSNAVVAADDLVTRVMAACGYPVESFSARVDAVSVDHPDIVDDYRQAHRVYHRAQSQQAGTEDLRGALLFYRSIFDQLLQPSRESAITGAGSRRPADDSAQATAPVPPAGTRVHAEEAGRLNSGPSAPPDGVGEDTRDLARPTR